MQTDFHDAHERHWDDAERLFQAQRWANADHLYGVAAECGLKRLMLKFGMQWNSVKDMPNDIQDRVHADKIWLRFETYRSGHYQGSNYVLASQNPFHDWDVGQRYVNQVNFDQAKTQVQQIGASDVRNLIKRAQRDGFI